MVTHFHKKLVDVGYELARMWNVGVINREDINDEFIRQLLPYSREQVSYMVTPDDDNEMTVVVNSFNSTIKQLCNEKEPISIRAFGLTLVPSTGPVPHGTKSYREYM